MGLINMRFLHTTPGSVADDPFCPPQGWEGDQKAYRELLRQRWGDLMWGQRLRLYIRIAQENPIHAYGPYAEMAARVINQLLELRGANGQIHVHPP